MNIGIVTTWFESGAGYVSRQYKRILEQSGNKVFIFARGGFYAHNDPVYDTAEVTWSEPSHVPIGGSFDLDEFKRWIIKNNLETIFFNEQTWWPPILLCSELGIKCGAYIDYYTEKTKPFFDAYDFLICNTQRHQSVFKDHKQSYYVPWGTSTEIFFPRQTDLVIKDAVTFFHSSGSDPFRKGTDLLLKSFYEVNGKSKLVIHCQKDLKKIFPGLRNLISQLEYEERLKLFIGTIGAPGLYYMGDVYVYPSRLDGIGLSMAEALASGLALIASDNGPMNEFVDERFGSLVKIKKFYRRKDDYYWPVGEVDTADLTAIMQRYVDNSLKIPELKKIARQYALEKWDWNNNQTIIDHIFKNSKIIGVNNKLKIFDLINDFEINRNNRKIFIYKISPKIYKHFHKIYRFLRDSQLKSNFNRIA